MARGGSVFDWSLIGSWLGVDRLKTAKDGRCTAWPAMARFGGGLRVVRRWWTLGKGWRTGAHHARPAPKRWQPPVRPV
jgi:hypothetical protein